MKRTITGIALVLALVFTATAWSQEPPMERGKMGQGKMGMGKSSQVENTAAADSDEYVYKQSFMPRETVKIDLSKTALFVTDPQNDFLSKESPAWGLVGPTVIRNRVVEKEKKLKALAKELGVPVFYSTHMYTPQDFANW